MGAFALFNPGQQTELLADIAAPEGKIHFAGEHTTLKHAWIEGAIESGIRAALEVYRACIPTEVLMKSPQPRLADNRPDHDLLTAMRLVSSGRKPDQLRRRVQQ